MASKTVLKALSPLVGQLYEIEIQIAELQARRAKLAADLIAQGEGTYAEMDDPAAPKAVVVVPTKWSTKYDLYGAPALARFLAEREAKKATPELLKEFRAEQEAAARKVLGDHFDTCFDRRVTFHPADGYANLIPRLFPTAPATAKKALLLCQIATPPKDAYVRLPDKPKAAGEPEEEA